MVDNIRIAPSNHAFLLRTLCILLGACSSIVPAGASALPAPAGLKDSRLASYGDWIDTVHTLTKRASGSGPFFVVSIVLIPVLVLLSGVFAGLTLGYMSLDETQLKVLSVSGSPKQQEHARKIEPLRRNGHLLLITLLIANMIVNETLPVISDEALGGGVQAVVVSTVLIVIFSEIIPQSVCSRYGLVIGAKMAPFVRVLVWALLPITWPVAKVLEYVLGPHHGIIYRRGELKELINMHATIAAHGGDLRKDTVTIVGGALDLQEKVAADAMTPIEKAFMLDIDSKLDYETLAQVVSSGHSRVPVFERIEVGGKQVTKIRGILLVKQCVLLDPEDATPLRDIPLNAVPTISFDEPLLGLLDRFQEGRSHMAIVSRIPRRTKELSLKGESIGHIKSSLTRRFIRRFGGGDSSSSDSDDDDGGESSSKKEKEKHRQNGRTSSQAEVDVELGTVNSETALHVPAPANGNGNGEAGLKGERDASKKRPSKGPKEQTMPADAVLDRARAEAFLDTLEGAPLGLITLEDVLEELIGEEIYDEFDLTGAEALPASSYVPPEAQRAVEAAKARARVKARLGAAVKPVVAAPVAKPAVPASKPMSVAIPQALKALKIGVERSRSAPGRTRDGSPSPARGGDNVQVNPPLEERLADPRSASSPPVAVIQQASTASNTASDTPPEIPSRIPSSLVAPTIHIELSQEQPASPASPIPVPDGPQPSATPPTTHVQISIPPELRRASPAPSMLSEALLERGRRRAAAAAALTGTRTPEVVSVQSGSTPVPPNAAELEERLVSMNAARAKGARFKSTPLAGGEKAGSTPLASTPEKKEG